MKNYTNKILELKNGKNYFVVRQTLLDGTTYYLGAEVPKNDEEFTNNFIFLEQVMSNGKFLVKEVTDPDILEVLSKNIKLD